MATVSTNVGVPGASTDPVHPPVRVNAVYQDYTGTPLDPNHPGWTVFPPGPPGPEEEAPLEPGESRRSFIREGFSMPSITMPDWDPRDFEAVNREVTDDELVEHRLQQLLDDDSPYIQQARRQGERAAAARGALSSSIFAGASQAAAIQAALPIAQQDAQTYYQTASENMQATNTMTMAQLQSATQLAGAAMQAQGTAAAGAARLRAAEIQADTSLMLQEMQNEHAMSMFDMQQAGRIELADLGFYHNRELQQMGFDHAVDMSELSHDQRIDIEERFGDPRFYANLGMQRNQIMSNFLFQSMGMYAQGMSQMNMADIDDAAFSRGQQFWTDFTGNITQMFRRMWGDDFPDINTGGGG